MQGDGIVADFSPFRPFGRRVRLSGSIRRLAQCVRKMRLSQISLSSPPRRPGTFSGKDGKSYRETANTGISKPNRPSVISAIRPANFRFSHLFEIKSKITAVKMCFYIGKSALLKYIFKSAIGALFLPPAFIPLNKAEYPHPFTGLRAKFQFTNFV